MNKQGIEAIQVIGVIILVVLVVVAVAVFFFAGLSEQGGILSESSNVITSNLSHQINDSIIIDLFD